MAETKTKKVVEEVTEEVAAEAVVEESKPKMVTVKFDLTRKEKDDIWVAVNGEKFLIKRGVAVEVPDYVAEVLEHSEEMLEIAMEYEAQASNFDE